MAVKSAFSIRDEGEWWPGLSVRTLSFRTVDMQEGHATAARSAIGRAVSADLQAVDVCFIPFWECIGSAFPQPPEFNLGTTVRDFVEGVGKGQDAPVSPGVRPRILFACNTTHTCFVRPNGFVFVNGECVRKPRLVRGLDEDEWQPLAGPHTAFVLEAACPACRVFNFCDHECVDSALPTWAISGPRILGADGYHRPPFRPRPGFSVPGALPAGPTRNDEVNYHPGKTCTSFTAFGVTSNRRVICVSMFEKPRDAQFALPLGINVPEMAELLQLLGAVEGIIGGGAADTQQFLRGAAPEFLEAPTRARRPEEGRRLEVSGPRGLGAILALLAR